jgi:hypothetical protein
LLIANELLKLVDSVFVQKMDVEKTCLLFGGGLAVAVIVLVVQTAHDLGKQFQ